MNVRAMLCSLVVSASLVRVGVAATALPLGEHPVHQWPADGAYAAGKSVVYVGVSGEPPNRPSLEYFDEATHRTGTLVHLAGRVYRSTGRPYLRFTLRHPSVPVVEDRHLIQDGLGTFGFSVWHPSGATHEPLIVLLEGADNSTRDMGFLIPYFVSHGMAVLTFDQRGTGLSTGNWRYLGPADKAQDVVAALRSLAGDRTIDFKSVGVWGPSNGGWVAPIVAQRYPLAFMILKSTDSESIADNVLFEVRQELEKGHRFSAHQVHAAMAFERNMLEALATNSGWTRAKEDLRKAESEPWFALTRVPADFPIPPPPQVLAAYRAALIYNPEPLLEHTTVPTLALFGSLDREINVAASEQGYRADFATSGMKDFTVRVFPGVDHLLVYSETGYERDELKPARFASGYPEIMINWLRDEKILP